MLRSAPLCPLTATASSKLLASLLALCCLPAACDQEDLGDEELAALDEDDELLADGDDESRLICFYSSTTPPSTNDSDTIIGAGDEVESTDHADGECDLHMFRVTADAPSDRARTIDFHATSMHPFHDYGAMVWTKSCAGNYCATNFSSTLVPLTMTGGGQHCTIGGCFQLPYFLDGQLDLSASNDVADIRAGMRATYPGPTTYMTVPVTITVSE